MSESRGYLYLLDNDHTIVSRTLKRGWSKCAIDRIRGRVGRGIFGVQKACRSLILLSLNGSFAALQLQVRFRGTRKRKRQRQRTQVRVDQLRSAALRVVMARETAILIISDGIDK